VLLVRYVLLHSPVFPGTADGIVRRLPTLNHVEPGKTKKTGTRPPRCTKQCANRCVQDLKLILPGRLVNDTQGLYNDRLYLC
jgi:hypothetical protein